MKYCHKYELSADKKYLLIAYNLKMVIFFYSKLYSKAISQKYFPLEIIMRH